MGFEIIKSKEDFYRNYKEKYKSYCEMHLIIDT